MKWELQITDSNNSPTTFVGDTPGHCIRAMMADAIQQAPFDETDLLSFLITELCEWMVEIVDGDPQDEYRRIIGDMGDGLITLRIHVIPDPPVTAPSAHDIDRFIHASTDPGNAQASGAACRIVRSLMSLDGMLPIVIGDKVVKSGFISGMCRIVDRELASLRPFSSK